MKNRGLAMFFVVAVIGLCATQASAKKAKKHRARKPAGSCGLYLDWRYLTGNFSSESSSDEFYRQGWGFGAKCSYNNYSRLTFGVGAEIYSGSLQLNHANESLEGSVSYVELGFKEWVRAVYDFNHVKVGALAGIQNVNGGRFKINRMQVDFSDRWFDITKLASEHLTSVGRLGILEAGLDVEFPLPKRLSITFGVLWQRYNVFMSIKIDDEGKDILNALNYDVANVERELKSSPNFFYLNPGVKWCGKHFCSSLVVPWGVFQEKKWSWGLALGTEVRF